ncbi:MAG: hypothetical protein IID03_04400 [Candidatus Dadabacteria bacterium]|nr:hypothetical protein [Candidatus Dadabacteria bacterium]
MFFKKEIASICLAKFAMIEKWLSYLNVPRFNRSRTGLIRHPVVCIKNVNI